MTDKGRVQDIDQPVFLAKKKKARRKFSSWWHLLIIGLIWLLIIFIILVAISQKNNQKRGTEQLAATPAPEEIADEGELIGPRKEWQEISDLLNEIGSQDEFLQPPTIDLKVAL